MKEMGFVVWVDDDRYVHRSFKSAIKRANIAEQQGKDTLIHPDSLTLSSSRTMPSKERRNQRHC